MPLGFLKLHEEELNRYIKEIASGNENATVEFYNKYGKSIYALVFPIVRSKESSEEVLQDVMMSIVRYGAKRPIKNVKAWLITVIINSAKKKAIEEQARTSHILPTECYDITSRMDMAERIENSVDQIEALKHLDKLELQCVVMCILWQMKLPEVAKLLNIPYKTARNKYYYAIKKIKKYYEGSEQNE